MVTQLGMSDVLGPVMYGSGESEVFLGRDFSSDTKCSPQTAALIDEEIKKLIDEGYATAKEILEQKRDRLDFVAEFLLQHEIMEGDQFAAAMDGATMEELEALAEEKKQRSRKENERRAKEMELEARAAELDAQELAFADPIDAPVAVDEPQEANDTDDGE